MVSVRVFLTNCCCCLGMEVLVKPLFDFAESLSTLQLDATELALIAAIMLLQTGIVTSCAFEYSIKC